MYDYMNSDYEELNELLNEVAVDEINWLFAEAFQNQRRHYAKNCKKSI